MIDGRLVMKYHMSDFHFTSFDEQKGQKFHWTWSCDHQPSIVILESSFRNSTILAQVSKDIVRDSNHYYGSCVDVHVWKIQIEAISNDENAWAISIYRMKSVILSDIVVRNNSSPLLHLFSIDRIIFGGCNTFS